MEPRPACADPARTDPDSADRRSMSSACLVRGQSGARTAPAPTPAGARTQMRAVKGRSTAGSALSNASRTKGAADPMPIIQPAVALSTRQEAFCRHYAASGNAADAARQAAIRTLRRQTGCALLERPYIVERLRRIRLSWKRTARDEVQIVLARLEQAWDAAVASGSAYMMVRVLRFQAEIAGLVGPADRRPGSGRCRMRTNWARSGRRGAGGQHRARPARRGRAAGPCPRRTRARPPPRKPGGTGDAGRVRRSRA